MLNNTSIPKGDPPPNLEAVGVRSRKKRAFYIAGICTGVLVAAGTAVAFFAVSSYNAETARLCTVATTEYSRIIENPVALNVEDARSVLESATDGSVQKAVPGAAQFSSVAGIEANPKTKVEARPSSKELIENVEIAIERIAEQPAQLKCETREDASRIHAAKNALSSSAKELRTATVELTTVVAEFKDAEKQRLEAEEKVAAEKKAAEEQAAAEEARIAAAQAAPEPSEQYYDSGYGDNTQGWLGEGGGSAPVAPAPQPPTSTGPGNSGSYVPPPPGPNRGDDGCLPGANCYL